MGLSGRKAKQRIPDDPRNLCWADDAARFGSNYLAKFGWDGSTGLGVAGEGRTSHIKVSHKLDLLGIGAAQQKDPDGIAWKQNKDFELLLQRLNDASATDQTLENGKGKEEEIEQTNPVACITEKKRKHKEDGEPKTKRKKRKAVDDKGQPSPTVGSATIQLETTVLEVKKSAMIPRHRAHRARAINAKNISSKSAAHISEVLGVAPIPSSGINSWEPSQWPQGKLTSLTDEVAIEKITTSTTSVADYFKEKLSARSSGAIISTSTPRDCDDSYDTPRVGLGSRARIEISTMTGEVEQEIQRMVSSKFPAFSSSLTCEKLLNGSDPEGSATTPKIDANSSPQTKDLEKKKKKRRKVDDEEMDKEGGAREDRGEPNEHEERKRKGKLDKRTKDHVDPQYPCSNLKDLKKQEKRKRKAEKASVTSHHTYTADQEYVHVS